MGLTSFVDGLSDEYLMLYGLVIATLVLWAIGGTGLGFGEAFQGWPQFLEVIGVVLLLNIVFGIIAFLIGLAGAALPIIGIGLIAWFVYKWFGGGSLTGIAGSAGSVVTETPLVYQLIIAALVLIMLF